MYSMLLSFFIYMTIQLYDYYYNNSLNRLYIGKKTNRKYVLKGTVKRGSEIIETTISSQIKLET